MVYTYIRNFYKSDKLINDTRLTNTGEFKYTTLELGLHYHNPPPQKPSI